MFAGIVRIGFHDFHPSITPSIHLSIYPFIRLSPPQYAASVAFVLFMKARLNVNRITKITIDSAAAYP